MGAGRQGQIDYGVVVGRVTTAEQWGIGLAREGGWRTLYRLAASARLSQTISTRPCCRGYGPIYTSWRYRLSGLMNGGDRHAAWAMAH